MGFALPRISWRERAPDLDPPGVLPAKLPRAIDNIGWAFTWGCIGFLLYFTWSSAGNKAVALEIDQFLWWQNLGIKLWLPLVVPYTVISIAVPIMVKYGLPMFMEFAWNKPRQAWPKAWSALLVVGGSLVIIAGSFVVQNDARLEQNRGGAVRVEQAAANKAAKEAELSELRNQLRILTEDGQARPTIEGKAAREGAAGWPVKVAEATAQAEAGRPVDVDRFKRAQSAAVAADALRDKITAKIGEVAAMPTQASVAERIVKEGDSATAFTDFVKQWRSLLLALIADLGALFCTWLAMRLADIRAQQLADWEAVHKEPIPEAGIDTLAIEDFSNQPQVRPQKYSTNEKGEKMVWVHMGYYKDGTEKGYWRVLPSEKKRTQEEMDAAAAAKDAGKRNASDWYVKNGTSMFDGLPEDGQNPQNEVSDVAAENNSHGDPLLGETEGESGGGEREGGGFQEAISGEYPDDRGDGAGEESTQPLPEIDVQAESLTDAPVSSPDEQALWTEATETEDGQFVFDDPQPETLLPNDEGVLVHEKTLKPEAAE